MEIKNYSIGSSDFVLNSENVELESNKISIAVNNVLEKENQVSNDNLSKRKIEFIESPTPNKKRKYTKEEKDNKTYAVPVDVKELTPKKTVEVTLADGYRGKTDIRVKNLKSLFEECEEKGGDVIEQGYFYRFMALDPNTQEKYVYIGRSTHMRRLQNHCYTAEYVFKKNQKSSKNSKVRATFFHKFLANHIEDYKVNVGLIPVLKAEDVPVGNEQKYEIIEGMGKVEDYLIRKRNTKHCPFKNPTGLNTNSGSGGL